MRLTRVHVEGPLTSEAQQVIRGTAANHITRVLRLRVGDSLTLFDGRGGEYDARINEFHKDAVHVSVSEQRLIERESPLSITLAQGVSRGERMDWVVQKATELGVARIVPVLTERCVVRLDARQSESKLRHWRAIVVAACEQCGRNRLPEVAEPMTLDAFLRASAAATGDDAKSTSTKRSVGGAPRNDEDNVSAGVSRSHSERGEGTSKAHGSAGVLPTTTMSSAALSRYVPASSLAAGDAIGAPESSYASDTPASLRLLLSPAGERRVQDLVVSSSGSVTVLIGPEGGLTEDEQAAALTAGFEGVRLGPRVLRTETAAIAALAAIQQQLGDL
jgi:RsmE family RNA methyltransferase